MALMVSQLERQGWFATGQIRRAGGSKGWRSLGRRVLLFQTEVGASREDLLPVPQWHPGVRGPTIGVGPSLALRIFPEQGDRFLRLCKGKAEENEAHLDGVMLEAFVS